MMNKSLMTTAVLALAVTGSASAATVWNVNIGSQDLTGYQGAATENAAVGSNWNNVTSSNASQTLADSTGSAAANVSLDIVGDGVGSTGLSSGDDIFVGWTKSNGSAYTVTLGNLSASATYDLVVYSDWFWNNGNGEIAVSQSLGTGLADPFVVNHDPSTRDGVLALAQDTNPDDVDGPFNWARINGLSADGNGDLGISIGGANSAGSNAPLNGFQLIEVPEPSSLALLGLGGLLIARRRRG